MPAPSTVAQFLEFGARSGILDKRTTADYQAKQTNADLPDTPSALAKQLIRDGVLTPFQAQQLLHGKWRGFSIASRYKVLERLGSGGMGNVFLCEHLMMRRLVALKVLPTHQAQNPNNLARFHREARAAASLHHPNIVRAYEIDQDGELHFLVMEYVDGASLQEIVDLSGKMDVLRACHYISQAAQGLQHAHESGLVHRDIKPANILVDRDGVVKVLDMGLARFFHDDKDNLTRRTDSAAVLGTADYIAPEQALDSHTADIRADIYGLGATFYFLLAGKTPFDGASTAMKLLWSQVREPTPINEVRREVPAEVARILHKMMAKKLDDRYQTPEEVCDALQEHIRAPISPPPAEELPKLCPAILRYDRTARTEPKTVTPAPGPRTFPRRTQPPPSTKVPQAAATPLETPIHRPETVRPPTRKSREAEPPRAPKSTKSLRVKSPTSPGRKKILWACGIGCGLLIGTLVAFLTGSRGPRGAEPPPGDHNTGTAPNTVEVLRLPRDLAPSRHLLRSVVFSPRGDRAVTAGPDNFLCVWNIHEAREDFLLTGRDFNKAAVAAAVLPDGRVVAGCEDGKLRLFDLGRRQQVLVADSSQTSIRSIDISADGKRLLTAGADKTIALWNANDLALLGRWNGHTATVVRAALSPDGKGALSADENGTLIWWKVSSGKPTKTWPHGGTGRVCAIAFTISGVTAWVASEDGAVRLWDLRRGVELERLPALSYGVRALRLTRDGRHLLVAGGDDQLHVFDAATLAEVQKVSAPPQVSDLALTPEGRRLVGVGEKTIRVWTLPNSTITLDDGMKDARVLLQQAQHHASRRDWTKAVDFYAQALKVQPTDDGNFWLEYAAVLLLVGDQEGYRKACEEAVKRCGKAKQMRSYHAARICTLAADSVKDGSLPGKLAEAELKASANAFWSLTQQGALAYRQGRHADAVPLLVRSLQADLTPGRSMLNQLWLAMAEHRLGKAKEAKQWLERAAKTLDSYPDGRPMFADDTLGLHLHNWLEAHVLRQEAEALLKTPAGGR